MFSVVFVILFGVGRRSLYPLDSSGKSKGEGTSLGTKIPLEFSENLKIM